MHTSHAIISYRSRFVRGNIVLRVEKDHPLFRPMTQLKADTVTKNNLARCTICGKRFKPFNRHHHLCSYKCRDAYNLQHKKPTERPAKECEWCHQQFIPDRATQNYCNRECWQKAKAAESKAARRVWWRVGRPTLRELEEAGIDGAGARRRWNSPIRKPEEEPKAERSPEEINEINKALAKIVEELTPKFIRRV